VSSLCVPRYRRLSEAAKDVGSFTKFVIERYTELERHLELSHVDEETDEYAQRMTSDDHDVLSACDPTSSANDQQPTADTLQGGIISSFVTLPL